MEYDVAVKGWVIDDLVIKDSFSELEPFATISEMLQNGEGDREKLKIVLKDALDAYEHAMWWRRHWFTTADYLNQGWYQTWKPGKEQNLTEGICSS